MDEKDLLDTIQQVIKRLPKNCGHGPKNPAKCEVCSKVTKSLQEAVSQQEREQQQSAEATTNRRWVRTTLQEKGTINEADTKDNTDITRSILYDDSVDKTMTDDKLKVSRWLRNKAHASDAQPNADESKLMNTNHRNKNTYYTDPHEYKQSSNHTYGTEDMRTKTIEDSNSVCELDEDIEDHDVFDRSDDDETLSGQPNKVLASIETCTSERRDHMLASDKQPKTKHGIKSS